jgi:hypothetical protein
MHMRWRGNGAPSRTTFFAQGNLGTRTVRQQRYQAKSHCSSDAPQRRSGAYPGTDRPDRPDRTEGLNMRGIFSFPIEQYAEALLPSWVTAKIHGFGR